MGKKFTSNSIKEIFYEIVGEEWIDDDTYVVIFQDMTDADGDTYHIEVEYHKDEEKITYTRVYEDEIISDAEKYVINAFRKQIDEYILKQVGVIGENDTIIDTTIELKLRLAIPLDMRVEEYEKYLNSIWIEINRLNANADKRVKVLSFENK